MHAKTVSDEGCVRNGGSSLQNVLDSLLHVFPNASVYVGLISNNTYVYLCFCVHVVFWFASVRDMLSLPPHVLGFVICCCHCVCVCVNYLTLKC